MGVVIDRGKLERKVAPPEPHLHCKRYGPCRILYFLSTVAPDLSINRASISRLLPYRYTRRHG
jgi:hypothetical protein